VRWVLGESKASELRGESMQDVIFNGTTTRKAASRSSVELVFDNADHRAGGQWSQFPEIAVKRVLTRDGGSSYYINNQPVRRRDVQDVFLGTGLGPRAYAIIGQGTISRIIESKPEELRLFLEEAAGVSKYKERRRETENRLSDTRENLTRVEDILRELTANLEKLEKQAEVAQRFNTLQSDVTLKQQQLWFLKRADAEVDQTNIKNQVDKSVTELESRIADLRHIETDLETIRQAHYAAGDQVNQSQGALYEASAEVGRLEAEIRFVVEGRQRAQARLAQMKEQILQWTQQSEQAAIEISQLSDKLGEADIQAAALSEQIEQVQVTLPEQETALEAAQMLANEQRNAVAQVQQRIQVLAADQRNIEEQSKQSELRKDRLNNDQQSLNAPDPQKIEQLKAQRNDAQATAELKTAQQEALQTQVPELDESRKQAQDSVNAEQAKHADLSARLQALQALHAKVQTNDKLKPGWLHMV
jgi:chromosome segregation protein